MKFNKKTLEDEISKKEKELEDIKGIEALIAKNLELDKELKEFKTKYEDLNIETEDYKKEITKLSKKPTLEGQTLIDAKNSLKDIFNKEGK